MKQVQDFYKATVTQDWSIGTGNFYVSVKPTITEGWLYVSPNNAAIREKIYYNGVGTDANGDYITVTQRGVGTTDEQTHSFGEPIRMNVGEDFIKYMTDAIEGIITVGSPNADTSTKGLVEIATDAQVIAGTDTGETGAKLVATPGQLKNNYEKIIPIVRTYLNAASPATWTKPAGLKYVIVEVQAGGGGGQGSRDTDGGGATSYGASGGGGGGYSKKQILAANLGATETVTIGAGGTAGATNGGAGGAGETSSFGAHASSTGGAGGGVADTSVGGIGSSGDLNIQGGTGSRGGYASMSGGNGGDSFFGGGGAGTSSDANGGAGGLYGGGGGGALGTSVPNKIGGAGAAGIVIVTEFY